jgi:hypothetical protein
MAKEFKAKEEPADPELIKQMMEEIATLKKNNEMLIQVADKRAMSVYFQRNQGKIPSEVMIRTMMTLDKTDPEKKRMVEKVIIGWKTTKDEVFQEPSTMRWIENQRVELLYEDGTSEEMYLRDFNRLYKQIKAEVKQKIVDEATGSVALKVSRLDNGREYNIGVVFIN